MYTVINGKGKAQTDTKKENIMTNATATFTSADQNWQSESTTYWFDIEGTEKGTGWEFQGTETYGIVESGTDTTVVDCDGRSMTEGDNETIAVRNIAVVNDAIRKEASGQ